MEAIVHVYTDEDGHARTINGNVKVRILGIKHNEGGATARELAEHYSIPVADVHAALAHYFDHLEYYQQQQRKNKALLHQQGRDGKALLAELRSRLDDHDDAS
ncbi:MAG: hypothetical protein AAFV33_26040 [Chloroflexota bacterium]